MKITIDGKNIQVEGPKTVLEAARENGIRIPSLCDHPELEAFGGCRLCLVEIEGRRGYPPACSTYLEDGMSIQTDTPRVKELRRGALELILSEHPNACLICREKENCDEYKSTIRKVSEVTGCVLCPNNGRCELQDVVEEMDLDRVHFPSVYRNLDIHREDPFFDRNYNLCILCGRCVRICREVRGASVLTFIERGAETVVGTVLDQPLRDSGCRFCGACVDVCPTGALTDRAVRYELLPDQEEQMICPLCSMGCRLDVKLCGGRFIQSLPDMNGPANHGQACVRGRFLLPSLSRSSERILRPRIRKSGGWEEVPWDEALKLAAEQLKPFKKDRTVLISSPQLMCEDLFVLKQWAEKVLNTEPVFPGMSLSPLAAVRELEDNPGEAPLSTRDMRDIAEADTFLLAGTDLTVSHPMIWLNVWKSLNNGGRMVIVSPVEMPFASQALWLRPNPGSETAVLLALAAAVQEKKRGLPEMKAREEYEELLKKAGNIDLKKAAGVSESQLKKAAEILAESREGIYFMGPENIGRPDRKEWVSALWNLALQNQAELYPLELESNQKGWDSLHPEQNPGAYQRAAESMRKNGMALVAAGPAVIPEDAEPEFTVALAAYPNEVTEKADVILPLSVFGEYEGLLVNGEGRVQKTAAVLNPPYDVRPAWRIASELGKLMDGSNFNFSKESEIRKFMKTHSEMWSAYQEKKAVSGKMRLPAVQAKKEKKFLSLDPDVLKPRSEKMTLMTEWTTDHYLGFMFGEHVGGIRVLRDPHWIRLNPEDAEKKNLKTADKITVESGGYSLAGNVRLDKHVPPGTVKIIRPGFHALELNAMNLNNVTVKRKK